MNISYAIHINALSSVYQDSTEKSKQTSQLLFGELCSIKSERNDFFYVENSNDKHCGWVEKHSFHQLDITEYTKLKDQAVIRVYMPLVEIFNLKDKTIMRLPAGSMIHNFDEKTNKFSIADTEYQIHSSFISYLPHGSLDGVAEIALSLLNTPFMHGGKSVLGTDKAGYLQLVFSLCGYSIPRSLQDQMKAGVPVYSMEQLRVGDLIYMESEDIIIGAFIFLGDDKAVGVSGKVEVINISEIENDRSSITIRRLV